MREIKFRGKTKGSGEWVYGDLIHECLVGSFIVPTAIKINRCCPDEVIPETIGQYTGLKDKNGKDIYEGDIIKFEKIILPKDEGGYCSDETIREIIWCESIDGMYCESFYVGFDFPSIIAKDGYKDCEVIGNIHENKELLET